MRLFIPPLGTQLQLTDHWEFDLHLEERNGSLLEMLEGRKLTWQDYSSWRWHEAHPPPGYPKRFRLSRGTVLVVDRIYIRRGAKDYDSVTFKLMSTPVPGFPKRVRFWAKLDDVNRMEAVAL